MFSSFVRPLLLRPTSLTERGIIMMTKSFPKPKQTQTALLHPQAQVQVRKAFSTMAGRSSTWPWTWTAAALLTFSGASGFVGYQLALKRTTTVDVTATSKSRFGSKQDYENAIHELKALFPGNAASTDADVLLVHGFSLNDYHPGMFGFSFTRVPRSLIHFSGALHSIVVYPQSTQDVVKIINVATKHRIPVVPYAGATSLEGHTRGHPTAGGICIDMSNMDRVLEIHRVYNFFIGKRMRQDSLCSQSKTRTSYVNQVRDGWTSTRC